ncbi:hypothetical protein D0T84_16245 [Dysgonomonas sp. 521]|uniref:hypothetical protein n=1 Tax=Dysgonomonas sp. 521 TaxID=2302932 RepID=UPI0013D05357|nr:hypothetical protein [Dysgonomonas sp. 521]NDV96452.1 hypothetical protein [Dysgonomonas sp. 521]
METKTKPRNKRNTKEVAFRDMIEHLHCFIEKINLEQARDPEKTHSDRLKATRTITENRTSHVFVNEDYVVVFAIHKSRKGGAQ